MKTIDSTSSDAPIQFVTQHQADVVGELHGFDRVRLQGTLPPLFCPEIMHAHLWKAQVLYKDYEAYVKGLTERMRTEVEGAALRRQRPVEYLRSSAICKEERAREVAAAEGITEGVICVFSCLETDRAMQACPNRVQRRLELKLRPRRGIHLYVYLLHAVLGFLYVRFQLWFPFVIHLGINGREWLAQQLIRAGCRFRRERNCFPWVEDVATAQALLAAQLQTDWPALCNGLIEELNPVLAEVRAPLGLSYYWTTPETEYATDIMFRDRQALAAIYPSLIHHGVTSFGCESVLRFLGRSRAFQGEVKSTLRTRVEGVCLKHRVQANSIKMYDKGSVLRVETTINQPKDFRVWRAPTNQPAAAPGWYPLRRSTADLHRRAQVSRAAAVRYLDALSAVHRGDPLLGEARRLCRRVHWRGQWHRALNPFAPKDAALLAAINDLKFTVTGISNTGLREQLGLQRRDRKRQQRAAGQMTRQIRLLRAHGLLRKIRRRHRYHVTIWGRRVITALLAAQHADLEQLTKLAA